MTGHTTDGTGQGADVETDDAQRVGTLRGAGVSPVNARRLGQVVVVACLGALLVLSVAFFVAAAHRNDQIENLQQHGVPVDVTVTGCLGLLGGSGSNAAGFACHGTFTLDGRQYTRAIPGDVQYAIGTTLHGVVVPSDPGLLTLQQTLATEEASASVYVLPIVLLAIAVAGGAAALVRWRRRRARAGSAGRPW